jgi:hypothetical protein
LNLDAQQSLTVSSTSSSRRSSTSRSIFIG